MLWPGHFHVSPQMLTRLFSASLCAFSVAASAAAPLPGDAVNMLGPGPRSGPRGCELIGLEGPDYGSPLRPGGVQRPDTYYWFGCPSELRPNLLVLWRIRDKRFAGELRIGPVALKKGWLQLSTGREVLAFELGKCVHKRDPLLRIDALLPVGFQAQEVVPVGRVVASWTVSDREHRIISVRPSELEGCRAG